MNRIAAHYIYTLQTTESIINGFVEYDDNGLITKIGKCDNIDSEVNYIDGAIVPGFVNAHCHIELSYLWKKFKKGTGMAGFIDQINEMRDNKSYEDKVLDIKHWMDKLWSSGVSAMADISNCSDSFDVKAVSPIYTRTFLEVFGTEPKDCEHIINSVLLLNNKAKQKGLDASPTPHSCYTMSPDLLKASAIEGLKSGYLSYHSQESQEEEDMIRKGSGALWQNRKDAGMSTPPVTGKSSLNYFLSLIAPKNEKIKGNVLLVHQVCMGKEDIKEVKEKIEHPFVALCPLSNLFIHNTLAPISEIYNSNIKLCIGTDSLSSNDVLDMVAEMYCIYKYFPEFTLGQLLIWACKNGAEFLGKENDFGQLKVGMAPGLVAIKQLDNLGQLSVQSYSKRII